MGMQTGGLLPLLLTKYLKNLRTMYTCTYVHTYISTYISTYIRTYLRSGTFGDIKFGDLIANAD